MLLIEDTLSLFYFSFYFLRVVVASPSKDSMLSSSQRIPTFLGMTCFDASFYKNFNFALINGSSAILWSKAFGFKVELSLRARMNDVDLGRVSAQPCEQRKRVRSFADVFCADRTLLCCLSEQKLVDYVFWLSFLRYGKDVRIWGQLLRIIQLMKVNQQSISHQINRFTKKFLQSLIEQNHISNFMASFFQEISHNLFQFSALTLEFIAEGLQSEQYPPFSTLSDKVAKSVVWHPSKEFLLTSHQIGYAIISIILKIWPFSPSPVISRNNSVLTTPGCKAATRPFLPTFSARAFVKRTLQSLDLEYATLGSQFFSKSTFYHSGLGYGPKPKSLLCASDETLIILKNAEASTLFQSRYVRQKWPRWLTPHCIYTPSLVVFRWGIAIRPALLIRQSIFVNFTELAKDSIEALFERSRGMYSTWALGLTFLTVLMTDYAVSLFLAPMITEHPNLHRTFTVSAPIPEFPPVTIACFPQRFRFGMGYCPPLKNDFKKKTAMRKMGRKMRRSLIVYSHRRVVPRREGVMS